MKTLKQNQTAHPLQFMLVSSSDHITGLTGATPTVVLSKNGGAFAAAAGAVSEIGSGWYQVAANSTDCNTLGPLILHATASGGDPSDEEFQVAAYDPDDAGALGLSAIPPQAHQLASVAASPAPTSSAFSVSGLSGNVANRACYFRSGAANAGEWNEITGGTAANPTFYRAWTNAPAAGDQLVVLGLVK